MKLIVIGILALTCCIYAQENIDITVPTIDNKSINLKSYSEKGPLLISFWALWCEPCKVEMRVLESLYKEYKEKGFSIISINLDSPKSVSKVRSYISSQKITFPVVLDPNSQYLQKFNGQSVPYSLLYDTSGKLVLRHVGYIPGDEKKLELEIQQLLD